MKKESLKRQRGLRFWLLTAAITAALLFVGTSLAVHAIYRNNLKPVSTSEDFQLVTIPLGSTVKEIADSLAEKKVIRQSWAFQWYVRSSSSRDKLQAGTYALRPNQSVKDIVGILSSGQIDTDTVTIFPSRRLDQIEQSLINKGFSPSDVKKGLKADQYEDHPALSDKPDDASLEGYLYPETFQKDSTTTTSSIVRQSLDQMQLRLTPALRRAFVKQGLTVHEGVTLASVVEKEVSNVSDRRKAAQVFLKRIKDGMALQSDVTVHYGNLKGDDGYNTYQYKGLPKGPISNVSESSLKAVASPAKTKFLFFVAGDDGITYFSSTQEEHQRLVRQHCSPARCPAQ